MAIEMDESSIRLTYSVLAEPVVEDYDKNEGRMSVSSMVIDIEYLDAWTVTLTGVEVELSGRKTKKKAKVVYSPTQGPDMPKFAVAKVEKVLAEVKGVFE